jgi:glycosyltransferase involved in cell wall biosynthesis
MPMKFWGRCIDSVVMLTWSDWKTEPRSNRYHFATRFARHVPVFFVQPDSASNVIWLEQAATNITIVHAPSTYDVEGAQRLAAALYEAGCHKPMLWIYNIFFEEYVYRSNALIRVLHATEDYLTDPGKWAVGDPIVREPLMRTLAHVDLLVAVSAGVLASYLANGKYTGETLLLENGCDSEFWYESRAYEYEPVADGRPTALFQGGINKRLDFPLLIALARGLPTWRFWFCGNAESRLDGWSELTSLPNVHYFGFLSVEGVAALAKQATVGLIPFHQDELIRGSLPLKAYEYVACGMPVVSVPVDAIIRRPDLFHFATSADEFALALEQVQLTRNDPVAIGRRLAAAAAESYDGRFTLLVETLMHYTDQVQNRRSSGHRYSILLLYDDGSTHVKTIAEHIEALQRYSGHEVLLVPAVGHIPGVDDASDSLDFSAFDAIVIHYSIRVSLERHLSSAVACAITRYDGPKLLYIQDEYENTETARRWIERLGVDTVFTCVPLDQIQKIYPRERFPNVDFVETLTGYVPEDVSIDEYAMALVDRPVFIGYRGRRLPHHYGLLGHEKYRIGVEARDRAIKLGLPVDIEVDDSHRIYGNAWYRFLGSCRATLGTESGSNVFDENGELKQLSELHRSMPYENFAETYLKFLEGSVQMNQISPKIFEAIRLRTALILFEGSYSGIVEPDVHYIALKKDFSNFDEVIEKIGSLDYLRMLTERAYSDIIESGRWSYRAFAEDFSKYLSRRLLGRPARARIFSLPMLSFQENWSAPGAFWRYGLMNALASGQILCGRTSRHEIVPAIHTPERLEMAPQKFEAVEVDLRFVLSKLREITMATVRRSAVRVPGLRWTVRAVKRLLMAKS